MMQWPIGIFVDNFHLEIREAIRLAAEIGAEGVQFAAKDPLGPDTIRPQEFRRFVADLGLEITAICGDVGGFKTPEMVGPHVEQTLRILDLARALGVRIVTGHIGAIPPEPAHPRYQMMLDACSRVAAHAAELGLCYAIETGPEPSGVLRSFLDDIHSPGIGVNLDPANFVMITGEDSAKAVRRLGHDIVHTHVKDGRMNRFVGVDIAYNMVPDPENRKAGSRTQTPIGEGSVDWAAYLQALEDVRYRGFLTIEREGGDDRPAEIRRAYATLRQLLGRA